MNLTELLDQFVLEARECLERIGQRLLEVERDPDNRDLLNDLFRLVHTLKGNCGLFEFKPLEMVVHAGEDLLDQIRNGSLAYDNDIADVLLEAMDYTAELVDLIAAEGQLPAQTEGRARNLAAALRAHLGSATGAPAAEGPAASDAPAAQRPPDWLIRIPEQTLGGQRLAIRYRPEADCFFKGEDPWRLARTTPGLVWMATGTVRPWSAAAEFDCYQCNLEWLLVSESPRASLEEHFRYVPEQIEWAPAVSAPAAPAIARGEQVLRERLAQLWEDQRALLANPGASPGTQAAARRALLGLLACRGTDDATLAAREALSRLGDSVSALAQWADDHAPAGAAPGPGRAAMALTPRRGSTPAAAPAEDGAAADRSPKVLKVAQDKIDRLMELIGEMVVAKNALPYLAERAETVFLQRELAREIKTQYSVINRIAEDMQHAIMQVRMLPVGVIFQRFSRLVRDISRKLGKQVELVIEGEATEADKHVIESLADPLIHILRNSLDHGIELPAVRLAAGKPALGVLKVSARQEGDRVLLTISDDGAGIDTDRVRAKAIERGLIPADRASSLSDEDAAQLVFLPGFSTTDIISDLSGRGVGMDVVRSAVERVNGSVSLSTRRGLGTTIELTLPLSMAVTNVMMIESGGRRFGVPIDLIVETVRVPIEDIHCFKQARTVVLRGRIVALRPLNELLSIEEPPRANGENEHAVLVVRLGSENIGLLVDDFHGTSDIILKPLEGVLAGITGFAGTALMGDGSVLMILNPKELF